MSGSRLVRGRGGRLAVYGGCGVVLILLVFLYRAATSEMAKLRELHEQCAHQQEALAAQLQVIFEYKVRLEKSLAEEKSSNVAVKQELQQRASREKSLRDKDSIEAMQRFNSLQQTYKLLDTEHKDLKEECDKRQKQALEERNRLESTLQELRGELRRAREDKEKSLEHLKSKYLLIENEKEKLDDKYNELLKNIGSTGNTNLHLQKLVTQLKLELEEVKKSSRMSSPSPSASSLRSSQLAQPNVGPSGSQNAIESAIAPSQQQNTSTTPGKMPTGKSVSSAINTGSLKKPMKLPIGVLPILKLEPEEKPPGEDKNVENGQYMEGKEDLLDSENKEKLNVVHDGNLDAPPPAVARHIGDQVLGRQENRVWHNKVRPGVQEVGDEPNHLEKNPGLDDPNVRQANEEYGQYEGGDGPEGDYADKEPPPKNNDIHIEEAEDEAEDEDDQMDYDANNLKLQKHPE